MTSGRAVEPRLYGADLGEWEPSGTHADAYVDGWNAALADTPAPRDGWEELRREIEAHEPFLSLLERVDCPCGQWNNTETFAAHLSRAIPRLAAARGEPGLDASHLAAALWAEFGWASPDPDQQRPRLLDPDDQYWQQAAERLIERLADPNIERAVSRIPRLAAALRGQS